MKVKEHLYRERGTSYRIVKDFSDRIFIVTRKKVSYVCGRKVAGPVKFNKIKEISAMEYLDVCIFKTKKFKELIGRS